MGQYVGHLYLCQSSVSKAGVVCWRLLERRSPCWCHEQKNAIFWCCPTSGEQEMPLLGLIQPVITSEVSRDELSLDATSSALSSTFSFCAEEDTRVKKGQICGWVDVSSQNHQDKNGEIT